MSQSSVVPRPVPAAARAPRRVSRRLLRTLAVASLAAAPLLATPRPAAANTPETYLACVNGVVSWMDACNAGATTWYGEAACYAGGVAGILVCAAIEAAEIMSGGLRLQ